VQVALTTRPSRLSRLALVAVLLAASALLTTLVLRTSRAAPELGYGGWSLAGGAKLVLPGLVALTVAAESLRRRPRDRAALLLALVGLASFLPELSIAGTRPALAFTAGLVLAWATPPLVAHLALGYPTARLTIGARLVAAAGYVAVFVGLGILPALFFDPVQQGCGECARNLVLVHASAPLQMGFERAGIVAALAWLALCSALMALRLVRATPAARRLLWPVLVPAAGLLASFGVEFALSLRRAYLSTSALDLGLWLAGQLALVAFALGFAARWLRSRRARTVLARDVIELSAPAARETVAERLAAALGDPTLEVAYAVGDPPRLVDALGAAVELRPGPGRAITELPESQAVLRHRVGLLDDAALADEIARAARLALANERLRADAQARLALLRASRKRIVEAGDAERQRLERNLHDGAQQRLVSIAVALRARSGDVAHSDLLDEAQAEIGSALEELRVIARGIYPAVLGKLGLAAALEALAETAPRPLKLGPLPRERLDATIEATAYFVVAEVVNAPGARRVTVGGLRDGDTLTLTISTDAPAGDLTRLSDRVGAVGGTIHRRTVDDDVILDLELPCAS
jgi:signal transduction histidine kinase